MVLLCIEECFQCKESILTAKGSCTAKLESCPMEFEEAKGTTIHDGRKNLAANIHEHNTTRFVWIGKVTFFGYRDALTIMPSFVVSITFKEISDIFMDTP